MLFPRPHRATMDKGDGEEVQEAMLNLVYSSAQALLLLLFPTHLFVSLQDSGKNVMK